MENKVVNAEIKKIKKITLRLLGVLDVFREGIVRLISWSDPRFV